MQALELIPQIQKEFAEIFGRDSGGLVRPYRLDEAETIIVSMGSVLGTIKEVVDERRERGEKIGVLGITSFRPFPIDAVREALKNAKRFVNIEKAFSVGIGGIVSSHCRSAVRGMGIDNYEVIAGLGGRPITKASLHSMLNDLEAGTLPAQTFLDLDHELVDAELARENATRRSGPTAENIMRDSKARTDAALGN